MVAECPTLSPDGRLIAADVESHATLIDRDTGTSVRIGGDPGCGYNSFGWAPDGDRLVVRRDQVSQLRDRRGRLLGTDARVDPRQQLDVLVAGRP